MLGALQQYRVHYRAQGASALLPCTMQIFRRGALPPLKSKVKRILLFCLEVEARWEKQKVRFFLCGLDDTRHLRIPNYEATEHCKCNGYSFSTL